MVGTTDLDDTSRCPVAGRCAGCGAPSGPDRLAVATADTPVGVFCLTLCPDCAGRQAVPRFRSWTAAISAVLEHCEHLGIDADQAAALRAAERGGR